LLCQSKVAPVVIFALGMAMARRDSKLDRFTGLFDKDWNRTRSALRNRYDDDRSYDPSYSWDAKSDNPEMFSKLAVGAVPVQPCRPVAMLGTRVISLESQPGQFLGDADVRFKNRQPTKIPLSVEQKDLQMAEDLSGGVPIMQIAGATQQVVTMVERPIFKNYETQPPKFKLERPPEFMIAAGPNGDQCLLKPQQRREIIEYEKRQKEALAYTRAATAARTSTRKQISGQQFKRGVLMVDSALNEQSEIYGDKAHKIQAELDYKAQIHLERYSQLSTKMSAMATNGNILVPSTVQPRVPVEKFYQSKGGNAHAFTFEETHNRLFCRQEINKNGNRTQKIRDAEMSGKQYDIVTHTTIEHWPSRHFDRLENKILVHPSQTSMEGTRNMQGATKLF